MTSWLEKYNFIVIAQVVDNHSGFYGANVNSSGNRWKRLPLLEYSCPSTSNGEYSPRRVIRVLEATLLWPTHPFTRNVCHSFLEVLKSTCNTSTDCSFLGNAKQRDRERNKTSIIFQKSRLVWRRRVDFAL